MKIQISRLKNQPTNVFLNGGLGSVTYNFESRPTKEHLSPEFALIWFSSFQVTTQFNAAAI